ncbi:MAG: class I SAM-dependent methyltransferase [Pyrinomonadaceae bacterium]|jgi:2-polyprenyl-3-methyl-5-hydroxy-6-metoxy-1,4-benzoquinol methylase|nr:class I SAM-dependent methyltransferase [Pyrinomonadaceae bacterium]
MNQNLISYYNERAKEYEKVYLNPAEQNDLFEATKIFQELFAQKEVLEIACGTGWWTERIAETAVSILATDVNESVIEIAKQKRMPENVTFAVADMFDFEADEKFDGVFAGFIWSHILLQDIDKFLAKVKSFLKPNGTLVLIDGKAVAGTNHDLKNISKTDEFGNTFQTRKLENGTSHLVLKNFPTEDFLHQKLSGIATDINFINLEYYWIVSCRLTEK